MQHDVTHLLDSEAVVRYRRFLLAEWEAASLYQQLGDVERDPARAALLRELASAELQHAARWRDRLEAVGAPLPRWAPGWRSRALVAVARVLSSRAVLPLLEGLERGEAGRYATVPGAADLSVEERSHRRIFAGLRRKRHHEPLIATTEASARPGLGAGNLRAAVFGVNDGLVSNLSLVMGVAGAEPGQAVVLLAGIAGLLGGAFSMAAGEYISVITQRERFQRELELAHAELAQDPEVEERALALILRAQGLPADYAARGARELMAEKVAAGALLREEPWASTAYLGTPLGAALSSFLAFAAGASIPVSPYLLTTGGQVMIASALLSGLALLLVGSATALLTGRPLLYTSGRMLLFGAIAATVTHLAGRLLGATVPG